MDENKQNPLENPVNPLENSQNSPESIPDAPVASPEAQQALPEIETPSDGSMAQETQGEAQNAPEMPRNVQEVAQDVRETSPSTTSTLLNNTVTPQEQKKPAKSHKKALIITLIIFLVLLIGTGVTLMILKPWERDGEVATDPPHKGESSTQEPTHDDSAPIVDLKLDDSTVTELYNQVVLPAVDIYHSLPLFYLEPDMMAGNLTEEQIKTLALNSLFKENNLKAEINAEANAEANASDSWEELKKLTKCQKAMPRELYDKLSEKYNTEKISDADYEIFSNEWLNDGGGCYSSQDVVARAKEIFGQEIEFSDGETVEHNFCGEYVYSALNDEFYPMTECGGACYSEPLQKLFQAEKQGDKIYLYVTSAWANQCSGNIYRYDKEPKYSSDGHYEPSTIIVNVGSVDGDVSSDRPFLERAYESYQDWQKYRWEFVWNGENYVFSNVKEI